MDMSTVEARRAILKAEYHRLEHYLHTLSPEPWQHPTPCDQWIVADVIGFCRKSPKTGKLRRASH